MTELQDSPGINYAESLTAMTTLLHQAQVDKGFWPEDGSINFDQKLMLLVGEVSEAHEELRSNDDPYYTYYREDGKPEGFLFELADVFIRLGDLVGKLNVNFGAIVLEKHEYNMTRPHKHGRNF